ncbi:6-bladed beta-propeller [Solimonas terrae]|uniref:6-bladed beta-propeller n=1 Tax=Solimonas terrae TaxID=1396819 RepID=A0A6M2BQB6_9GAMM|nr:6-bladed beta-propeller [Solimonas terrae]NGY04812.1 6-bladed beta-propeller [Solimonas terrae]
MSLQRAFGKLNELGSDAFIAGTRFLSKRNWVSTSSADARIVGAGAFRYRVDHDWCKAMPDAVPVKNAHEMAIDADGHLYLLTDHPRNNVIVFDRDGCVLDTWTLGLRGAHGLTIATQDGRQCLWICDPYAAQVIQTTLKGEVLRRLPGPHALGLYRALMPYAPTQTAVAPNGDIYVADGYGSQHVLQFDAAGNFIRHFGGKGSAPENLDFAHGIAIDSRKGRGHEVLLVTSRRQSCIKRFSLDGHYLGEIKLPGGYPCRPVLHGEHMLVSLCWSGAHMKPNSGFVVILDMHDRLCTALGGTATRDAQGELVALQSSYDCFHHVHDVCADLSGNLYVAQWNADGVYPWRLAAIAAPA